MSERKTTHIGDYEYGDGEYVVHFENVRSMHAPMVACVFGTGSYYGYTVGPFADFQKPSVELAAAVIAKVRADERKEKS
jgi:hypothetical protein